MLPQYVGIQPRSVPPQSLHENGVNPSRVFPPASVEKAPMIPAIASGLSESPGILALTNQFQTFSATVLPPDVPEEAVAAEVVKLTLLVLVFAKTSPLPAIRHKDYFLIYPSIFTKRPKEFSTSFNPTWVCFCLAAIVCTLMWASVCIKNNKINWFA